MTLTDTHPPLHRAGLAAWALTSGIAGFVADVLLVLDQLTETSARCASTSCGFPPPSPGSLFSF
jgi:hypothetical protein